MWCWAVSACLGHTPSPWPSLCSFAARSCSFPPHLDALCAGKVRPLRFWDENCVMSEQDNKYLLIRPPYNRQCTSCGDSVTAGLFLVSLSLRSKLLFKDCGSCSAMGRWSLVSVEACECYQQLKIQLQKLATIMCSLERWELKLYLFAEWACSIRSLA